MQIHKKGFITGLTIKLDNLEEFRQALQLVNNLVSKFTSF